MHGGESEEEEIMSVPEEESDGDGEEAEAMMFVAVAAFTAAVCRFISSCKSSAISAGKGMNGRKKADVMMPKCKEKR